MPNTIVTSDPSAKTIESLNLAMSGFKEVVLTRFAANDEAVKLLQDQASAHPTAAVLNEKYEALKELTAARFEERKASADLALTAVKEATAKSETNFTEQLRAMSVQIGTNMASLEARITDLKERMDRGEGGSTGSKESYAMVRTLIGIGMTAVIVTVAVTGLILSRP